MEMWCTTGLWLMLCLLVLQSAVVASEIAVFHGQKEYKNHSVVHAYQVKERRPLECHDTAVCTGCNSTAEWFYPNGTSVTRSDTNSLYITGGSQNGQNITLNLHRKGDPDRLAHQGGKGFGLYHCRIKTNGSSSGVQDIYVGLYRGKENSPSEGKPNVTGLEFHLDSASTDPFQSKPPVFTLTCHSIGGPATNVTWRKDNSAVEANTNHRLTSTLIEQLGPVYRSTLTVSKRTTGTFTCNVSNWKGRSQQSLIVRGTNHPRNLAAIQKDATTVQVSWTAPSQSGGSSPTGYRIFYRAVGDQQFTTIDCGQGARMYSLTDLIPGTSYMIAMVTLSAQLPSHVTSTHGITLVSAPRPPVTGTSEVTPQSISITWDDQQDEDSYIVAFKAVTNCPELQHRGSRTMSCSASKCAYTLTGLKEYSNYSITVTVVNVAGNASATINATTLPAFPSGPPQNVRGTAGVSTITVQWDEVYCTERNSEIVNYSLTYSSSTESKTVLVPADTMVYTISGLRPVTNYTIALAAVNTAGQVGPKATIAFQTQIPAFPTFPSVIVSEKGLTSKKITVMWKVEPFIASYELSFKEVTECSVMQKAGYYTVPCNATNSKCSYTLTGLNEYSHYSITITAVNVAGNASATINATTMSATPSGPPENVRGTAGVSTITVQWDEVDCIDRNSEIVYYKLTHTLPIKSKTVLVSADNMVYTIRGLRPETDYTIELAAVNTAGQVGPNVTLDVMTLPGGQAQDGSHSSSDKGSIAAAAVVSACLSASIAVAITVAVIIAKQAYMRRVSSTTADVRKEPKLGHELYSISTTDCVAYGTATNRSGDCQEARDYEIPAATSTSLPVSATACEQVEPAIYEPIPH